MAARKRPAQGKYEQAERVMAAEAAAFTKGVEMGQGELFTVLQKIEARLEFLNERDNLNSFALAGAGDAPMLPPRAMIGGSGVNLRNQVATAPTSAPQPPSIFDRLNRCEIMDGELDIRISQLYSRVSDIERALFGESKG